MSSVFTTSGGSGAKFVSISKPALTSAARNFDLSKFAGTSTVAVPVVTSTLTSLTPGTAESARTTGGPHDAQSMPTTLKLRARRKMAVVIGDGCRTSVRGGA